MTGQVAARDIWMYWENLPGHTMPPYLELCRQTVEAHAGSLTIHCLDECSVFEWLDDVEPETWKRLGTPVRRSDYLRVRLLERYGGLWLDVDCIVLSPLDALIAPLEHHEVVSWGADCGGRFYNNLVAARPHAPLIQEWAKRQEEVLVSGDTSWAALGQDIMRRLNPEYDWYSFPRDKVAPIAWQEWRRFLSPFQPVHRVLAGSPHTVVLWNALMSASLARISVAELIQSPLLLARLFRIALGLTQPEDESPKLSGLDNFRFTRVGRSLEFRARRAADRVSSRSAGRTMPAAARSPEDGGVLVVLPGYLGRTAVIESIWLQSANLARALGARLGRADILTPAGLLSPEEVEARAILPESEGSSARAVATRLPTQLALLAAEARSWLRAQAFRRAALRLTAGRRYSLVVQVHRRHHTAGEAIAHRDGVPYVRRVEALEVREEAAWGVRRPFWGGLVEHVAEVAPIKRADAVAVISRALDDQLEQAGVSGNRRWILPSGVDTNRFSPGVADRELLRRHGLEGRFVVGWIGGFRPFHGLELIPRIASRIRDENLDAVLCLVGTGPSYDDVARSVQYLEDRVVLVGPAPHADVPRWVRSFDACLLLASSAEFHYSPLKLYEYMACGRPVIAASAGEIVDLIEDEVNGLLVPPGDADAVVVALEKLISDPVLLAELGRRARETVEASGSWEARASDVLAVLARRGLLSVGE